MLKIREDIMFIVCLFYELGIKSSNGGYVSLMLENYIILFIE